MSSYFHVLEAMASNIELVLRHAGATPVGLLEEMGPIIEQALRQVGDASNTDDRCTSRAKGAQTARWRRGVLQHGLSQHAAAAVAEMDSHSRRTCYTQYQCRGVKRKGETLEEMLEAVMDDEDRDKDSKCRKMSHTVRSASDGVTSAVRRLLSC